MLQTVIPGFPFQSTSQGSIMSALRGTATRNSSLNLIWGLGMLQVEVGAPTHGHRVGLSRGHTAALLIHVLFPTYLASDFQGMKHLQNLVPRRYLAHGHLPRQLFVTGSAHLCCCKNNKEGGRKCCLLTSIN